MKRWNKRLVMLAAAILLMTAGTLLNVAISTNGGNVKVRRVTYSDSYGNMVSGILYIPRTATRETPAPAVLHPPKHRVLIMWNSQEEDMWYCHGMRRIREVQRQVRMKHTVERRPTHFYNL